MEEKWGKLLNIFGVIRQIALALTGISEEMKRFNDIQEQRLKSESPAKMKKSAAPKKAAEAVSPPSRAKKKAVAKTSKIARAQKGRIPDLLYNSILEISREKPEFFAREVISHAMKSAQDAFQKQSLNTALQGFKVGSKTAGRQPAKCRELIVPVEGQRGLYRLNPEKMPLPPAESMASTEML